MRDQHAHLGSAQVQGPADGGCVAYPATLHMSNLCLSLPRQAQWACFLAHLLPHQLCLHQLLLQTHCQL